MDLKKIVVLGGVGLISAAVGVVIPRMTSGGHGTAVSTVAADAGQEKTEHEPVKSGAAKKPEGGSKAVSHGKVAASDPKGHGKAAGAKLASGDGPSFVSFGRIMVNLNEPTMTKFFQLEITLQTDAEHQEELTAALEARRPILNTWLTSHLADKTMEDIRGKVGVNRLRREIQDNFNALLFKDGHERVQDILFEEYQVQ